MNSLRVSALLFLWLVAAHFMDGSTLGSLSFFFGLFATFLGHVPWLKIWPFELDMQEFLVAFFFFGLPEKKHWNLKSGLTVGFFFGF